MTDGNGPLNTPYGPRDVNSDHQYYKNLLDQFLHLIPHTDYENVSQVTPMTRCDASNERLLSNVIYQTAQETLASDSPLDERRMHGAEKPSYATETPHNNCI